MILTVLIVLLLMTKTAAKGPKIKDVSAMCSSDGITASIDFDGPFRGKIYSLDYATIHDCLYYNGLDSKNVLFSIPAHRCGTQLSRSSRNIVDRMSNRIYVQMDRDFQSDADKQFSFICQLAEGRREGSNIRRHPQTRDIYPTPPTPQASPLQPPITPVHALSTDARRFGNWPIPGSRSYDPSSMSPAPVFPQRPVALLDYPKPPTPPAYPAPPIVPQIARSPPIAPQGSQNGNYPIPPARSPIGAYPQAQIPPSAYTQPPVARAPVEPIQPASVNLHQAIGMGLQPAAVNVEPTKVPAPTWNMPITPAHDVTRPIASADSYPTPAPSSPKSHENSIHLGGHFKEEPKRIGVEFTNDEVRKETTRDQLVTTQSMPSTRPDVVLEIQRGPGPDSPTVSTPVKIGENISLVVKADTTMPGDTFDMFVHSCFAADGPGSSKVDLIDEHGCVLRPEFVSELKRDRKDKKMIYHFGISAFKFPGPDDVYFSCSIELTPNKTAPEICPGHPNSIRKRRDVSDDMRLFDNVKVELMEEFEKEKMIQNDVYSYCLAPPAFMALIAIFLILLMAFLIVCYIAMSFYFRLSAISQKNYCR